MPRNKPACCSGRAGGGRAPFCAHPGTPVSLTRRKRPCSLPPAAKRNTWRARARAEGGGLGAVRAGAAAACRELAAECRKRAAAHGARRAFAGREARQESGAKGEGGLTLFSTASSLLAGSRLRGARERAAAHSGPTHATRRRRRRGGRTVPPWPLATGGAWPAAGLPQALHAGRPSAGPPLPCPCPPDLAPPPVIPGLTPRRPRRCSNPAASAASPPQSSAAAPSSAAAGRPFRRAFGGGSGGVWAGQTRWRRGGVRLAPQGGASNGRATGAQASNGRAGEQQAAEARPLAAHFRYCPRCGWLEPGGTQQVGVGGWGGWGAVVNKPGRGAAASGAAGHSAAARTHHVDLQVCVDHL